MASLRNTRPFTEGATGLDPDALFERWARGGKSTPENNDLRSSIISTFSLPQDDAYVYHAIASVTLSQVQAAINHGGESGLHAWYLDDNGKPLPAPNQNDVLAYTSLFAPQTSPSKILTGFSANARKGSIRSNVASYLRTQRLVPSDLSFPRCKNHVNPYFDFWVWSCLNLEWVGPDESTEKVKMSHHILPVFMHHFGCVVPSHESLEVIKHFSGAGKAKEKKAILEIGSGNGYWAYMLRKMGVNVVAVDNQQSRYRTVWIGDTIVAEGEEHLRDNDGCEDMTLLMVYPIVSADFTAKVLDAYKGDIVVVAGTQNRNGYTAFKDRTINEYIAAKKKAFEKVVQIPLPSFAGKDEALFVFERKRI